MKKLILFSFVFWTIRIFWHVDGVSWDANDGQGHIISGDTQLASAKVAILKAITAESSLGRTQKVDWDYSFQPPDAAVLSNQ